MEKFFEEICGFVETEVAKVFAPVKAEVDALKAKIAEWENKAAADVAALEASVATAKARVEAVLGGTFGTLAHAPAPASPAMDPATGQMIQHAA